MGVEASHHDLLLPEHRPYDQSEYMAKTKVPKRKQAKPVDPTAAAIERRKEERLAPIQENAETESEAFDATGHSSDTNLSEDRTDTNSRRTIERDKHIDNYSFSRRASAPIDVPMPTRSPKVVRQRSGSIDGSPMSVSSGTVKSDRPGHVQSSRSMGCSCDQSEGMSPKTVQKGDLPKQISFERKIKAKTTVSKITCLITGMAVLAPDKIIVADNKNHSVKIMDLKKNEIVSRLKMCSEPWDITVLPDEQVAVSLPKKSCVHILSTQDDDLSKVQTIQLNAACYGIRFYKDRLYILCATNPVSLVVMSLQGDLIFYKKTDAEGNPLFKTADHMTVIPEGIYVSDRESRVISKLSFEGDLLATYKDDELSLPSSLTATGDGHLLVCSWLTHDVLMITTDLQKEGIVASKEDGMLWPQAMCYCQESATLYVASHGVFSETQNHANFIRVFKLV